MKIYYMFLNEKELLIGIEQSASALLSTRRSHSTGFVWSVPPGAQP